MQTNISEEILNMTLEELLLNKPSDSHSQRHAMLKIYHALKYDYTPVNTVRELIKLSQLQITKFPRIGKKSLAVLLNILSQYHITLPVNNYRKVNRDIKPCISTLHTLPLHSHIKGDYFNYFTSITRVPGGWIYEINNGICFVPFSNEFSEVANG